MRVSKDRPLAEITLRKYEKPYGLSDRELAKKLCLSIGLLQPGDSRDVIADIFYVLVKENKELTAKEIEELVVRSRKQHNLALHGVAPSNIRRQLKRLKDLYLIESIQNQYRIAEKASLLEIFEEKIEKFYLQSILSRVKEYFKQFKI
jgi:DNA-binding transcriptional ArsR family regulator